MKVFVELFVLILYFSSTFAIEEAFCAGTGYSNGNVKDLGLRSAGFLYANEHPLVTIWAANHHPSPKAGTSPDGVVFKINLVEQKLHSGTTAQLNGWLHVEVKKTSGYFHALALWAATDTREPIGEFVNLTTGSPGCKCWKQAQELLPCSAVPIDASINPNMFVYAHTKRQTTWVDKVEILFKMSTSYCRKPKKFRFYAATNTAKWNANTRPFKLEDGARGLGPLIYTTPWIEPKFFGAPTSLHDASSIQCTKDIFKGGPVWLKKAHNTTLTLNPEPKWLLPRWKNGGTEDTKVSREIATCKAANKDSYIHHGGRCRSKVNDTARTYAGLDILPICNYVAGNFDVEDLQYFTVTFTDELLNVEKYLKSRCACPEVPTAAEVKELATIQRKRRRYAGKKRQVEFENYQDTVESDVDTVDSDGIHDAIATMRNFRSLSNYTLNTTNSTVPVLVTGRAYFLSDKIQTASPDIQRPQGLNFTTTTTTTDETVDLRAGEDAFHEKHKDDAHFTCRLGQNTNFSEYNDLGLCVESAAGKIAYGVRQWHATATLLCTVVLVPVASYMARYNKGALPVKHNGPAYVPVKVWYIVHILIILPILCLYTTGMVAIRRQRSVLGYSFAYFAKFHRIAGTMLFALMGFQIVSGFLRPVNMFYRKLAIWVHFIVGLIINYGGLLICILTYRIPGSPTAFKPHVDPYLFNPMTKHIAPMVLAFWGVADIAYQAFITLHVMQFDKSVRVNRPYFPVIIPTIAENRMQFEEEYDKEHSFQKGTLTAYIICSVFVFFVTCISMYYLNDERGRGFGPMYGNI